MTRSALGRPRTTPGIHRHAGWLLCLPLLLAPARAEARGCTERSEILGKQRCSRFGDGWDVSKTLPWVVGLGPSVAHFPVNGMIFTGSVAEVRHDALRSASPFSVKGDGLGQWTSISPALRIAIFPARVFYVGVEGQAGLGLLPETHPSVSAQATGKAVPWPPALAMHATGLQLRSLGAIVGASVPVWRFDLSLEVLGGFRALSPYFDWDHPSAAHAAGGGCWKGVRQSTTCPSIDTDWTLRGHVEPRAGVALRVYPWLTLRALVGVDPLADGAVSASVLFELHTRTYDGFFQRRRVAPPSAD